MEWNVDNSKFERRVPTAPPTIDVQAKIMRDVHIGFGIRCESEKSTQLTAVTDTGCQTSTAGEDIMQKLGIKQRHLIPTCHRIIGITDTRLKILGVVMLQIELNGNLTRQMVYISSNSSGLYLSETALKELGVIDKGFPNSTPTNCSATKPDDEKGDSCKCIPRVDAPERPSEIPFPPTEENVEKLRSWLIDVFSASAFNTCTHQHLKEMTGAPMRIVFKEDYEEHRVHTPIEVPHYWKYKVKEDLDMDVRLGIIEPVPQGTPTTWCTRMVVTAKKNGNPRRTVDLQKLKEATLRETHFTRTPFSIVSVTPSDSFKTVLDAWNGYHSLPLSEEARDATTFITEWGRYRYCRAPQGYHASGDAYTRRFDDITTNFDRVSRCVDDSLLWDDSIEDAFWHTFEYLKHCTNNGIIFNQEKFVFAKKTCEFAGFELTPDGYRPPERVLDSIMKFPTPKSITDIRSWFGLINQVAYAFSQSQTMAPFRDLLSHKNKKFYWDEALEQVFKNSKVQIVNLIKDGVRNFEINRPTCLSTDWSKSGIGYTLTQKYCDCTKDAETKSFTPICGDGHWKLVLAGSRFTKPAETRYAPVEGEALAVAYGLNQCRLFILGSPDLTVAVDHKPLVNILNDRALASIENPRILRLKEKTLPYEFKIIHVPGKSNNAPDAMSRYPGNTTSQDSEDLKADHCVDAHFSAAFAALGGNMVPGSIDWTTINNACAHDEECVQLVKVIEQGFPKTRNELPELLRRYYQMRDDLYVLENAVFKGRKILIPKQLRARVLEGLHAAHQGVVGMKANARERLFWPGLDADLKVLRDQCERCAVNAPSQPDEPMLITSIPEMPFQQVVTDFYVTNGMEYLIYADRFSGWTEVAKVSGTSIGEFTKCAFRWFRTFGVPEEISHDGGPPFNSEDYKSFLKTWGITSRQSSAYYPQSNGRAEVAVKSMKRCLDGNVDPRHGTLDNARAARAIMTHRNTPCQDTGISPAEMLYGYRIRDHLPNKFREVRREWSDVQKARELRNALNQEKMIDLSRRRSLDPLKVGDAVRVQNQAGVRPKKWNNTGRVVKVLPHRQYGIVIDGSRRATMRNRKFLRKMEHHGDQQSLLNRDRQPAIVVSNFPVIAREDASINQQNANAQTTALGDITTTTPRTQPDPATPVNLHPTAPAQELPAAMSPIAMLPTLTSPEMTSPEPTLPAPTLPAASSTPHPEQSTMTNRTRRALNVLRDHNSRGLTESPVAMENAAPPAQNARRSSRARKITDRFTNN